jgi:hypothetical protein
MTAAGPEQRNLYKGSPPRCCVRLRFVAGDGSSQELELLADTGNPCAVIIGVESMRQLKRGDGPDLNTNFGPLHGGWVQVLIPELGFDRYVLGYASDVVQAAARASSPDFEGLAGLPLLRMVRYGGDPDWFWLRPAGGTP